MIRSILFLLACATFTQAQTIKLPADQTVGKGEWAVIKYTVDGGAAKWRLPSGVTVVPVEIVTEKGEFAIVVKSRKVGVHTLECWNAKGDVASDIFVYKLTVEADSPDPGPGPGPDDPKPPAPVDPNVQRFKDAVKADGVSPAKLASLITVLDVIAANATPDKFPTFQSFGLWSKAEIRKATPEGLPPKVFALSSAVLEASLPPNPDEAWPTLKSGEVARVYSAIANYLRGAK